MTYRAPSYINKDFSKENLSKTYQSDLKGDYIVIHAFNFKYDVNGNKTNHYHVELVPELNQTIQNILLSGLARNKKTLINCEKRRKQGGKVGFEDALYHLEKLGYNLDSVTSPKEIGSDGYVAVFKII